MVNNNRSKRVCLVPNVSGVGGMVSFRGRLEKGLTDRRIGVSTGLADTPYSAILVIGGTRDLLGLWNAKRRGIRIIQRLDGMNWIHRKRHTGWRHFMRAEYGNFILSQIRSHLADEVVYQSKFSHVWWERIYGPTHTSWRVVFNGVDLELYTPAGVGEIPKDHVRVLLVEGSIAGGYEWGLETAIQMAERLKNAHSQKIELMVIGRVSPTLKLKWKDKTSIALNFIGQVPADRIPGYDRAAHFLYAADINAACPNSVIEALACGLPVVAFDTGALPELLIGGEGKLVSYGGDPWKLEPPDIGALAEAAQDVISNQPGYRSAARSRAEGAFGLDQMVEGYLSALNL